MSWDAFARGLDQDGSPTRRRAVRVLVGISVGAVCVIVGLHTTLELVGVVAQPWELSATWMTIGGLSSLVLAARGADARAAAFLALCAIPWVPVGVLVVRGLRALMGWDAY